MCVSVCVAVVVVVVVVVVVDVDDDDDEDELFGGRFCSKRHIGFGRSIGVVMAVAICFAVQQSELQLFDYRNYNSRSRGARF